MAGEMTEGQLLMNEPTLSFQALTDAACTYFTEHDKEVAKNLEALKCVRSLSRDITFPLGGERSVRIEVRGPEPTKETFEQIVALVKVIAMGAIN